MKISLEKNKLKNTDTLVIKNIIGPLAINPKLIDRKLHTILVDGALNHKLNLEDSLSIGDNDSIKPNINHACDIKLNTEKDFSDLYYALKHIDENEGIIECFGFIGGRLDHQLMVYGDLYSFLNESTKSIIFKIYSENSLKLLVIPPGEFEFLYEGEFSLFLFENQMLTLEGDIKYPIKEEYTHKIRPISSAGLSNISYGNFKITSSKPLLLFINR